MSLQSFEGLWWIVLPLVAIVFGSLFSSRPAPQWAKSLALMVVAVGGSIVLLSSATAALHARRLSLEQSHSPVKYETYVSRPAQSR